MKHWWKFFFYFAMKYLPVPYLFRSNFVYLQGHTPGQLGPNYSQLFTVHAGRGGGGDGNKKEQKLVS
jgi:hypothetical protein